MRLLSLIPAVAALFLSNGAMAQTWDTYVNRDNFFSINLPGEPTVTDVPYKTAKGTTLTAHVFTAVSPPGSRLAGKYTVTVVDYSNAKDEIPTASEQAENAIKAKGTVKYDGINNIDLHLTKRLTVETATTRTLAEVLVAANNRLYITQAETALNIPPPAIFQAALQILDDKGSRIRTRTNLGVPEGVTSPIGAGGIVNEPDKIAAAATGTWRAPGGSCATAYFKSTGRTKTKRDEDALAGTVTNQGKTFSGDLILVGSRLGQFVDPNSDLALMLFDPQEAGKLGVSPLNGPAAGWPEVTLEKCTG
jgi:hypothetical protein